MVSREVSEQVKLHLLAAEQLEQAVFHNRQAAKFYNAGDVAKGNHHAELAERYYVDGGTLIDRVTGFTTTLNGTDKRQKTANG